jgi:predicted transposase YbfD/YdcC
MPRMSDSALKEMLSATSFESSHRALRTVAHITMDAMASIDEVCREFAVMRLLNNGSEVALTEQASICRRSQESRNASRW